jgi:hypothetical protein
MSALVQNESASKQPSVNDGVSSDVSSSKPDTGFKDNRKKAISRKKIVQQTKEYADDSNTAQLKARAQSFDPKNRAPIQRKGSSNLPDNVKSGVENLSGVSMDDVNVHYNSDKPAQLQAHAYAQGTDIHVAAGQEKHIPHEAWHVVQQKQGRVKPTKQLKEKVAINDDDALEREADVMGAKAIQGKFEKPSLIQRMVNVFSSRKTAQLAKKGGGADAESFDEADVYSGGGGVENTLNPMLGGGGAKPIDGDVQFPTKAIDSLPTMYHTTADFNHAKYILQKIDISKSQIEGNRFGQGFYLTTDPKTSEQELAKHGKDAIDTLEYHLRAGKILDVTNKKYEKYLDYDNGKALKVHALENGFDGLAYLSKAGSGLNVVLFRNFESIVPEGQNIERRM